MDPYILMRNITKVYPNGIAAIKGVDFSVEKGEIHGLIGENGAGKTTLMKILFGMERPTAGTISVAGQTVKMTSPHTAIKMKLGMVQQHFMLVPTFTVAENLVLGMEPKQGITFLLQRAIELTEDLSRQYGLPVPPRAITSDLSVGLQQRVEILKILLRKAECLIFDEPTSVLTPLETKELFCAMQRLATEGKVIIFITHKLREVKEIADRITILRNGKRVAVCKAADVSEQDITRMMVGEAKIPAPVKRTTVSGPSVLSVRGLTCQRKDGHIAVCNLSFDVAAGEILAIAGIMGNGQTELVEALTGLYPCLTGTITVNGEDVSTASPRRIRLCGLSHIPADRMGRGIAAPGSITDNLIIDRYFKAEFSRHSIFGLRKKQIRQHGEILRQRFNIKAPTAMMPVQLLSGGNMQRVVIAREFTAAANLMIADQPTQGIDIASTLDVRQRLLDDRNAGKAILLISADLSEILQLADRIVVLYNGEITAHFSTPAEITTEELGYYMLGAAQQAGPEIEQAA
ncbi:ABC transporter ATP-binding protein [Candidatus Acetothermia bacterium]|jgi:simple sugar transport system ATP-binding protein|nr:ABC transporter ATP-binding protein [Candidatus Acetothermia bacterium]MCI2427344.1 ABC transporter ATP-binding protein [Candidatus Acetothermia bacterium]MCI2428150.1 ABC transporter ATP-binding protein [Candidatus Acetothermia bacterium]